MNRINTLLFGFLLMVLISLTWITSIWSRYGLTDPIQTTGYIMNDLKWLGPLAFIFDILFFYFIYKVLLPKKEEAILDEFVKGNTP